MKRMKLNFAMYDVVKKKCDYWGEPFEEDDEEKDELYMILGFDKELKSGYEIISLKDGNEEAWWDEDYLEFVRKGSREEYLSIVRLIEAREEYEEAKLSISNRPKHLGFYDLVSLIIEHREQYTDEEFERVKSALSIVIEKEMKQNDRK